MELVKSEFESFTEKFPNISFGDREENRNKGMSLFQMEPHSIRPQDYNLNVIDQYKKTYCWNKKIHKELTDSGRKAVLINGYPLFDNYYFPDGYVDYDMKIPGICLICLYRTKSPVYTNIAHKRYEVFQQLSMIEKHCYGKIPYLGEYYRGTIGRNEKETWPSSVAKLNLLNRYRYCLCFENCDHDFYSSEYLSEKLFDCFRAKTIAIYLGCANINEYVPDDCFINFRKFKSVDDLSNFLLNLDQKTYISMTEKAFEFVKNRKEGNIQDLKNILKENENE